MTNTMKRKTKERKRRRVEVMLVLMVHGKWCVQTKKKQHIDKKCAIAFGLKIGFVHQGMGSGVLVAFSHIKSKTLRKTASLMD